MVALFNTLLFNPFYNGLLFLIGIIPGGDVGVAVILLTIVVKLVLFSLSYKSIKTQVKIKELEPEIQKIREEYKDDKQQQAMKTMAFYRENDINPFSSFLTILIQIPVILALYFLFVRGGLPEVNTDILYSFVRVPEMVSMSFIGLVDISQKSIVLALLAGLTQFFQARLLIPKKQKKKAADGSSSLKDDFAHSMQLQMRYVLPVFIVFIAYNFAAAVALYWTASNLFAIGQELFVRRRLRNQEALKEERKGATEG